MITVEEATESDIFDFIHNVRDSDKEEVRLATGGKNIVDAMRDWKKYNTHAVKCDGELIGVGGWTENWDDNGVNVWLLLTNEVMNHKIEFLRWSKQYHDDLLNKYVYVWNNVYLKNTLHVSYLKWLGAHFHPYHGGEWALFIIKKE